VPWRERHVVRSNGVLNLATDKLTAFREIVRVLRPGGRLQLGDIVVESELSEKIRRNFELWAA
jgi:arsenite methyltransferase